MPLLDHNHLGCHKEYSLALQLLSFIGSGYVWQDGQSNVPKVTKISIK